MRGIERNQLFYLVMFLVVLLIIFAVIFSPLVQGNGIRDELELRKFCVTWQQYGYSTDYQTMQMPELSGLNKACLDYVGSIAMQASEEDLQKCKNVCMMKGGA